MNKDLNYRLARAIANPFIKAILHPTIIGKENIPKNGPIILCGNHLNACDQFPIVCATERVIHWMAKKEFFEGKFGFFFDSIGLISVDRDGNAVNSFVEALRYLRKGAAIGIFPEGTRNKYEILKSRYLNVGNRLSSYSGKRDDKYLNLLHKYESIKKEMDDYELELKKDPNFDKNKLLLPFNKGVIALAKKSQASIVPFAVTGDYTLFNKNLVVRFDEPFKVEGDVDENNQLLQEKISSLVKRNYNEFGRSTK